MEGDNMNKLTTSAILLGLSVMSSAYAQIPGTGMIPDAPTKAPATTYAPPGTAATLNTGVSSSAKATTTSSATTYAPSGTAATLNTGVSSNAKATTVSTPSSAPVVAAPASKTPTPAPSAPVYTAKPASVSTLAAAHTVIQSGPSDGNTPLSMKYDPSLYETPPVKSDAACALKLMPVVDARLNRDTLGTNRGLPLLSGDAGQWATAGLQNLESFGFTVGMANAGAKQNNITLSPKITRAYTWQVGMKLFGTVVIKMDYLLPDGRIESRTFRASGNKNNMWGADDEYMTTLNYALNTLLKQVAADVGKQCASKT
jgi:hypothetical protein